MIDYKVLEKAGLTQNRLREFFTRRIPRRKDGKPRASWGKTPKELRREIERDIRNREKFEARLGSWLQDHIYFCLENHRLYSAVDLAWDATPISKQLYPLMLYAQGRIDIKRAASSLATLSNGDQYIQKDDKGNVVGLDVPKLLETDINIMRSVLTRRLAAQSNKYQALFPFFKYEPRKTSLVGKLKGDLLSQRMDIMADQYDYRGDIVQYIRDMLLYTHSVAFPISKWEREVQMRMRRQADEFGDDPIETYVTKEGLKWFNPHPGRCFWDKSHPLRSLNSDTGCEYVGYWDVCKYGDILDNPEFFNRDQVTYNTSVLEWFDAYRDWFRENFDSISPPPPANIDPASANDAKLKVGVYNSDQRDAAVFFSDVRVKVVPQEIGLAAYPYPVWLHLKVAGDNRVVWAEVLPSQPCAVFTYNQHDGRALSQSMAMELMRYNDALSNLITQLIETTKRDLLAVGIVNSDVFPDTPEGRKALKRFREMFKGANYYVDLQVLEASFAELRNAGVDPTADNIFKVARAGANPAITNIFESITRLIALAERMTALSPQEQGQPAPREISATETNLIAGTTESVYGFISDGVDAGRAVMKKICFESLLACGSDEEMQLPVAERYPADVVRAAGFEEVDEDGDGKPSAILRGDKWKLEHDFVFTTRDGAERAPNYQGAKVMVELLRQVGQQPPEVARACYEAIGKTQLFAMWNEIARMTTATDLVFRVKPGEDDALFTSDQDPVIEGLAATAERVKGNTLLLQQLLQTLSEQGLQVPQPQPTNPKPQQVA